MSDIKNSSVSKKEVVSGFFWRFAERIAAQGVSFIVQLVLARILMPEDYGTVALIVVITNILQVFVDSGMGNALIQKKDADNIDFSTVFYFNIAICILVYLLLFFFSPLIADFYNRPEMTSMLRVAGIVILIAGVKNIQQAYVSRNMIFKRFFFATIIGTIISAFVGIGLALRSAGAWALIAQQLTNPAIDTLVLWITVKWRPTKDFSMKRLKGLFSYGWKLLVSSLIDTTYNNLRQLVIGKLYSSADLAFYNRGKQLPELAVTNIDTSINSVLLPTMSREQDDKVRMKSMTRRAIRTSSYVMWPIMLGLMATATPLVSLILTDKWLPAVPYIRVFCLTFAVYPIHTANLNAIQAMGRSDLFLKLEIIKKSYGMAFLIATMWFGPMVMAYSLLVTSVLSMIVNSWPNRKLMNYTFGEMMLDILPDAAMALVMGAIVYAITFLHLGNVITLIIQIPLGIVIYALLSKLFHIDSFEVILDFIRKRRGNEIS
jgi:O-antigen/teichoic acid export membrane protein